MPDIRAIDVQDYANMVNILWRARSTGRGSDQNKSETKRADTTTCAIELVFVCIVVHTQSLVLRAQGMVATVPCNAATPALV